MPSVVHQEETVFSSSEEKVDSYVPVVGVSHNNCDFIPKKTFISCISDSSKRSRLNIFKKFEEDTQTFKDEVEKAHNSLLKILNEEHRLELFAMIKKKAAKGQNHAFYKFSQEDLKKLRYQGDQPQWNSLDNLQFNSCLGTPKQIIMNWLFTLKDPNLEESLDGFIINVFKTIIPDDEVNMLQGEEFITVSLLW